MSDCNGNSKLTVGGIFEDSTFKNPTALGGSLTGPLMIAPDVSGGMKVDDATAVQLAGYLAPHLSSLLGTLYKNCEGNPLSPGTALMSCAEVETAIELAICNMPAVGPGGTPYNEKGDRVTSFRFDSRSKRIILDVVYADGLPSTWQVDMAQLIPQEQGDQVTDLAFNPANKHLTLSVAFADGHTNSWTVSLASLVANFSEKGDKVTNFAFNQATNRLRLDVEFSDGRTDTWSVDLGSLVPTPYMEEGDKVINFTFNPSTNRLQLGVQFKDGTIQNWPVDLSGLQTPPPFANTVAGTPSVLGQGLPLSIYGGDTALLGAPVAWTFTTINGVRYRVPLYDGA